MDFKYMLAPLEDTSDNALRELCFNYGADQTFTEMTRLSGLIRNNQSTLRKIDILNQVPTQIQIAAKNEDDLKEFLNEFKPKNGFNGINLNLGCPSPHLIRQGLGCALIKRVSKVSRMVSIIKEKGYACTIKMRLGMNEFEKRKKVYLNIISEVDADYFIVHARHGAQHYEEPADNLVYKECVDTGKNIMANGDIDTKQKVNDLKKMGCKGIMIGRAAVTNPGIFKELKEENYKSNYEKLKEEYEELAQKYFEANNKNTKYQDNVLKRLGKPKTAINENNIQG